MSALLILGTVTACGSEDTGAGPMFGGLANSCAQVSGPAMGAIRSYTGALFSDTVEFEDESAGFSDPEATVKVCTAQYQKIEPWAAGNPLHRTITLSISLRSGDDAVAATERHFDRALDATKGSETTGLGDESFASWDAPDNTASSAFRKSNVFVSATVFGSNMSEREGVSGPRAGRAELAPGARAIAKALAADLGAVLTSN
ncbi:hypothetical protein [Nocardia rhamnosiphila]|uniref:hypothetical protein n=1 Tax=Nocardia rhamnosiphila TaxID=426716 RepID=UPI0012DF9D8B|nr:hypothetical protein [Nocardia rhamnosiphila]